MPEPKKNTNETIVEKRFKALIENANEIITLTNKEGKIIYISPSVTKITGYSFDELKDAEYLNKLHPDYKKDSKKILEESLQKPGVPIYRTNHLIHKNGSSIWMEGTVTNLLNDANVNAIVSNFRNITERKNAEEQLKRSENNLSTIFNSSIEAIILLDANCIIKTFNTKANDNFKIIAKGLQIGASLLEYIPTDRQDYFMAYINRVLSGETIEYDVSYEIDEAIAVKWFHVTLSPAKEDDIINGICITRRDITNRKKIEEELKTSEIKYRSLSEELAISNSELEQFAYIASHDLQEPLRMISSFLNLLELKYKEQLDDKARQYIHFASDGALRMRKIILDLLEYSMAGKKAIETETINTNDLLSETIQMNRKLIEEKNALIEYKELPLINGNTAALQQVFQNLIINALKYQRKDVQPVVKIKAIETETRWQFAFEDNGIGIDADFFEKIFIVFQRLHTNDEFSGTGLGLAICKKIIENHGGKIWVESKVGNGSTFYFTVSKQLTTN